MLPPFPTSFLPTPPALPAPSHTACLASTCQQLQQSQRCRPKQSFLPLLSSTIFSFLCSSCQPLMDKHLYTLSAADSIGLCYTTCYITIQQMLGGLVRMLWSWHQILAVLIMNTLDLSPSSMYVIRLLACLGSSVHNAQLFTRLALPSCAVCACELCLGQVHLPMQPLCICCAVPKWPHLQSHS